MRFFFTQPFFFPFIAKTHAKINWIVQLAVVVGTFHACNVVFKALNVTRVFALFSQWGSFCRVIVNYRWLNKFLFTFLIKKLGQN